MGQQRESRARRVLTHYSKHKKPICWCPPSQWFQSPKMSREISTSNHRTFIPHHNQPLSVKCPPLMSSSGKGQPHKRPLPPCSPHTTTTTTTSTTRPKVNNKSVPTSSFSSSHNSEQYTSTLRTFGVHRKTSTKKGKLLFCQQNTLLYLVYYTKRYCSMVFFLFNAYLSGYVCCFCYESFNNL